MLLDDAVAAPESQPAQFFMQADRGQVRVAFQQLRDLIRVGIQQSGFARTTVLRLFISLASVPLQNAVDALTVDIEQACDRSLGSSGIVQPDDLVARGFVHAAGFISVTRSRLRAATDAASRDSRSKRGARTARSSAVSPARPWCASQTSMRPSTSNSSPTRFQTWFPASLSRGSRPAGITPFD